MSVCVYSTWYTVVFDVWGQRCKTVFQEYDAAVSWIVTCYDKGFIVPICLLADNSDGVFILHSKQELIEMMP